jgi:ABC-type branched-chain amino acid transport systems, ATPase component
MGEATPAKCSVWTNGLAKSASKQAPDPADGATTLLPWTGSAMGTRDLSFLTGRGEAKLIALIGAHNAGKTTLLASWYQQLGRTGAVAHRRFAGSFSLEGWEAVAHALRWDGAAPSFPPHTPSGAGRAPGMLRLALRGDNGRLEDYIFADSPGEWFERWAVDVSAPDADGARWLSDRAATLVIVADCEALSGPKRGTARSALLNLLRRTAAERRSRPVALVWSKADVAIANAMRETIREAALRAIPDIAEFEVSISDFSRDGTEMTANETLTALLDWALLPLPKGFEPALPRIESDDPFFHVSFPS